MVALEARRIQEAPALLAQQPRTIVLSQYRTVLATSSQLGISSGSRSAYNLQGALSSSSYPKPSEPVLDSHSVNELQRGHRSHPALCNMLASVRRSFAAAPLFAAAAAASYAWSEQGYCPSAAAESAANGALDPNEWRPLKLAEKTKVTHNSYHLRFELPAGKNADLPVASCLLTKAPIQKPGDDKPKAVIRPYTPVTSPPGYMDLVIKAYPQGLMSKYLGDLKVGDQVDFKGPLMKYPYKPNLKQHIGMVAGGTGITPMLQVAEHILSNPADKTQMTLVFANVSEEDILLKGRLDQLAAQHPGQFKVHYVVNKASWGGIFWKGSTGFITRDTLTTHMPPPGPNNLVMVCGPPGMMAAISGDKAQDKSQGPLSGLLKELGYSEEMVYKF